MSEATVYKKLRPIKLAFIIAPNDTKSLKKAITINTYLWGGKFNPIIPFSKRIPKYYHKFSRPVNYVELINGYIKNFDPDFIIPMGISINYFDNKNDDRILEYDEILKGVYEKYYARYGISIFELLNNFYEKELKFIRKYPINLYIPKITRNDNLFLSSIFGSYDATVLKQLSEHYNETLGIKVKNVSIENYLQVFINDETPLIKINNYGIDSYKRELFSSFTLFILDSTSSLDIIDFTNLRATGIKVFPIAKQVLDQDQTKKFILEIANRYYQKSDDYSRINLLKSRSVDLNLLQNYVSRLKVDFKDYEFKNKFVIQNWYPRMWEDFGRKADNALAGDIEVKKESESIQNLEEYINVKSLSPDFRLNYSGTPRYATELNVRVYSGNKETFAEVLPEGDSNFTANIGFIGVGEWRISQSGLVYFSSHGDFISLKYPLSERVMFSWFKNKNWDIQLSSPGLIAKEMLHQLGNTWNINLISKPGLTLLFEDMANGKSVNHKHFKGKIDSIIRNESKDSDSNFYIKQLIDSNIFKLGLDIQCKICNQNSWFSISELDYNLSCPKCLNSFSIPSESVSKLKWAYRLIGPFSLPQKSYGIYTVLLTLRFFS